MQRINTAPIQPNIHNGGTVFDGKYIYYCLPFSATIKKIHIDDGVVATIDISGRTSSPQSVDSLYLNANNNIVGFSASSCAFCLANSDNLSGTFVPADDDFVWITISSGGFDRLQLLDGETLYADPLGIVDALTGQVLDSSGAYYLTQQTAHCSVPDIYGCDGSGPMYTNNLRRIDVDTLGLVWEEPCSSCWRSVLGYDGYLYAIEDWDGYLYKFDPVDGNRLKTLDLTSTLTGNEPILVDTNGDITIADTNADSIWKIDNDGNTIYNKSVSGLDIKGAI